MAIRRGLSAMFGSVANSAGKFGNAFGRRAMQEDSVGEADEEPTPKPPAQDDDELQQLFDLLRQLRGER